MSGRPAAPESNARDLLSGDQRGVLGREGPLKLVICMQCWPSLPQVQISLDPDRLDANAIRLPSGEYCARRSHAEESVSLRGGGMAPARAGTSCLQMFPSIRTREYARRPVRVTAGTAVFLPNATRRRGAAVPFTPTTEIPDAKGIGVTDVKRIRLPLAVHAGLRAWLAPANSCGAPALRKSLESGNR